MRFTDKYVNALKPREKRYEVGESGGLYIRVAPSGKKTWVYKYWLEGRWRRMTIGEYPSWTLAEARKEAAKGKTARDKGEDPAQAKQDEKKARKTAPTVKEFGEEYIDRWAKPNKKSWKDDERTLTKDVYPVIGKMKLASVKRRDIVRVVDKIKDRGAEVQANRTLACVRRMFNFAVERGVIETTPASHIKATREKARDRVLTRAEIKTLLSAIQKTELWLGTKVALELILRTAQRPGEVRQMEKHEVNAEEKVWIIPAEKSKNGLAQVVPLTDKTLQLIDQANALSPSSWSIPSPFHEGSPLSEYGLAQGIRRIVEDIEMERTTPHDLRRTAATIISELGFNRLIVDKILNHKDQTMGGVYDRHSYDKEKRMALEAWERELNSVLNAQESEKKVLSFGSE
jgi:integrase